MSAEGIFTVALAVTGNYVINTPIVESHGFVFTEQTGTEAEIKGLVQRAIEAFDYQNASKDELCNYLKRGLKNYFYKRTKQSPLIIVSIIEV